MYRPVDAKFVFEIFDIHNQEVTGKFSLYQNFNKLVFLDSVLNDDYIVSCIIFQVNSFVGAFHDAVLLYAIALNETLADPDADPRDGALITRRMWNRTFEG